MLDAIKRFVTSRMIPARPGAEPREAPPGPSAVQLAACALLLELAHADDEFSPGEQAHIEAALHRHFGLDAATASELLALAESERRKSLDHFQFARTIREHYDLGQRMVLAEVMWGVILVDGEIRGHEGYLVRKLGHLLDLAPAYLAEARRAANSPGAGQGE
jgi:uncharacterized tellurite resistance protein B-like protein